MPRRPIALAMDPATIAPRTGSSYPDPFRAPVAGGAKRALGDALALTRYGVNLVELEPGAWSSQRDWHSEEDEFVYVIAGTITLVTDGGRQALGAGMVAGFPGGKADGHHLVNEGSETAVYLEIGVEIGLEIGDRSDADAVAYPDIDLRLTSRAEGRAFQHRDGSAYEE